MMAEEDKEDQVFDKFDVWFFVIGIGFTLITTVALKYLLDGGAGNCYHSHSHFHGAPRYTQQGGFYKMNGEGKYL
jgi:hypothetical protein